MGPAYEELSKESREAEEEFQLWQINHQHVSKRGEINWNEWARRRRKKKNEKSKDGK